MMKTRKFCVFAIMALIVWWLRPESGRSQETQKPADSPVSPVVIPSGQKFILRLETDLHTRTTKKGDRVEFSTAADVAVDRRVLLPNKSWVRATVIKAKRAGRLSGRAEIRLRFDEAITLLLNGINDRKRSLSIENLGSACESGHKPSTQEAGIQSPASGRSPLDPRR